MSSALEAGMKVEAPWLRAPAPGAVLDALGGAGHRAWAVGGAVRDALMGLPVGEVDLATDALPARTCELASAAGLRALPTGIEHGTVTILSGGRSFEVTTLRRDVETDGRHARVAFGTDLREDAARRDFTMNALYMAPDGTLEDPLGGLGDVRARRVRFVGDARRRLAEDHLRALRFFRLHAWRGDPAGGLDPDALDAVARNLDGLDRLSRERVTAEVLRLLAAPDPAPAVAAMAATGALGRVLPGASPALLAPLVHVEGLAGLAPDAARRLAALGAEDPGRDLRLSRAEAAALGRLRAGMEGGAGAGELGYRLGEAGALGVLGLRAAAEGRPIGPDEAEAAAQGAGARLPVSARDLPGLEGPALGQRLRDLEARWIASGFRLGREGLLGS